MSKEKRERKTQGVQVLILHSRSLRLSGEGDSPKVTQGTTQTHSCLAKCWELKLSPSRPLTTHWL